MKRPRLRLLPVSLLCAVVAASVPAGSGLAASAGEKKTVTLRILHNWGTAQVASKPLQALFARYERLNPGIKIKAEVLADTDVPKRVETAFVAGQEPEIVFENSYPATRAWVKNGVVIPLNKLVVELGLKAKFKPEALTQYTFGGKLAAFPLEGISWPVWYNTGILKRAGVAIPRTTDQLLAAIPKIRAAGVEPFAVAGQGFPGMHVFNLVMSTWLTNKQLASLYAKGGYAANQNAVKGIRLFVRLRDAGFFQNGAEGLQYPSMPATFFEGKAAMMFVGSWEYGNAPENFLPDIRLGGFPLPTGSPHKKPIAYETFAGKGVWITRNGAKKLDAVKKFITLLYSPRHINAFVQQVGLLSPLLKNTADTSKMTPLAVRAIKYRSNVNIVPLVDDYMPPNVQEARLRACQQAYVPGTSAADILKALDDAYKNP
jgi:multiple sugar transport system substrate-binding protein